MAELETRWLDLGEFIREQRNIGHLSLRKLSEMAGISNPYLSQIERGLRKPSAEILQQIARALEISSETLYVRAGILEDDRTHDLGSEIRRDPFLTEDQKKALISIYASFRSENEREGRLAPAPSAEESEGDAQPEVEPTAETPADEVTAEPEVASEAPAAEAAEPSNGAAAPQTPGSSASATEAPADPAEPSGDAESLVDH